MLETSGVEVKKKASPKVPSDEVNGLIRMTYSIQAAEQAAQTKGLEQACRLMAGVWKTP
jgi:hypothetical protein